MTEASKIRRARAVADVTAGILLASIEIKASPERMFGARASEGIAKWRGSPEPPCARLQLRNDSTSRISAPDASRCWSFPGRLGRKFKRC